MPRKYNTYVFIMKYTHDKKGECSQGVYNLVQI